MKRIVLLFGALYFSLQAQTITLLHTNDMHCQYTPMPATWIQKEPKPLIGGMVALEYAVRMQREKGQPILLLDAGDIMTGTPIAKIPKNGVLGGAFAEMMNIIGYQAMTLGNHEFDEGQANLDQLIKFAHFNVLSANLFRDDKLYTGKPYAIYKIGSLRVGVIGLTLKKLFDETAKKNLDHIRVEEPAITAQKYIDQIDPITDLIIILSHQGVEEDLSLAEQIHNADLIIGGHSHTRLNKAIIRNGVIVVQADSKTRYLGRLAVTVAADTVANFNYELIPTWVDSVKTPNKKMKKLALKYQQQIDKEYNYPIGTLTTEWVRNSFSESNIGDFIADAIRAAAQTDFAVINSGGIRKDVSAGPLRKLDIVEILPFTNYLAKFQCSGAELLTLLESNAKSALRQEPGILQVSGLKYEFRIEKGGTVTMLSAQINGAAIDPNKSYSGAAVDFVLFGQALKYFGFEPKGGESTGLLLSDVVMEQIKKQPQVSALVEGRITYTDLRK